MTIQGAVLKEQNVTFALVVVKSHVLSSRATANTTIQGLSTVFGGIPVVLVAQDSRGTPSYFGRPDIARFMSSVPLHAVPWKQYHL